MNKVLIWLAICLFLAWKEWQIAQVPRLIFCDVGQGDAILVTHQNTQLLVDAGPDSAVLECLARYLPWSDNQLEVVLATHPDSDHIGGLSAVFQQFKVGTFVSNGDEKETAVFLALERLLQRKETAAKERVHSLVGSIYRLNPIIKFQIISPRESELVKLSQNDQESETKLSAVDHKNPLTRDDYNDRSIVLFLTINRLKVLLTGDLETPGEIALVDRGLIQDVDVLKIAHHGSKSSTGLRFLAQAKPEISVLSLEENNRYGHPAPGVLSNLAQIGSKIVRTDQHGNIIFYVIGHTWSWRCQKSC